MELQVCKPQGTAGRWIGVRAALALYLLNSAFVFKKIESILMEWEALWHMLVIVEADLTLIAFPSLLGSSGS